MQMGVPSTEAALVSAAQLIQQHLELIGIDAEIVQLEWGEYIDAWNSNTYDSLVGKNGPGRDPDRSLNFFFSTTGSANVRSEERRVGKECRYRKAPERIKKNQHNSECSTRENKTCMEVRRV